MVFRIVEEGVVIAYEVGTVIQVHRLRICRLVVYGSQNHYHCVFARLEREAPTISSYLPNGLYGRDIVPFVFPHVSGDGPVWVACRKAQAVEVLDLVGVIMDDDVGIELIVAFFRIFGASSAVDLYQT